MGIMPNKLPNKLLPAFVFCVALTLLFLLLTPAGQRILATNSEEALLLRLLSGSGAELSSAQVTGWVKVDDRLPMAGEPAEMAAFVGDQLGLSVSAAAAENWQNAYARGGEVKGALSDGSPVAILGQVMEYPDGNRVSHVMVNLAAADYQKTGSLKKQIRQALRRCGKDERVSVSFSAQLDGAFNDEELVACAEKFMNDAGAVIKERVVKENMVSLTGYSKRFAGGLRYDGQEVNLNVAVRRSPSSSGVLIYLASPVILSEY